MESVVDELLSNEQQQSLQQMRQVTRQVDVASVQMTSDDEEWFRFSSFFAKRDVIRVVNAGSVLANP